MKLDSPSTGAVRQVNLVFNKPGVPKVGLLPPRLKHRLIAGAAAAMLAFAVGLLAPSLEHGRQTSRRGLSRPPSEAARTASACSLLRRNSRRPISLTSATVRRVTSTRSIAGSSVRRQPHRVCTRAARRDDAAGGLRCRTSPR